MLQFIYLYTRSKGSVPALETTHDLIWEKWRNEHTAWVSCSGVVWGLEWGLEEMEIRK